MATNDTAKSVWMPTSFCCRAENSSDMKSGQKILFFDWKLTDGVVTTNCKTSVAQYSNVNIKAKLQSEVEFGDLV